MKRKDLFLLTGLTAAAAVMVIFSSQAREGAYDGLILAQNTIIPSLLPLLIIFLLIMKTGAKDIIAKLFGFLAVCVFNLPKAAVPAIFFGFIGGYPTGALLTRELLDNGEIDCEQAKRLLRFNVCGGCGFIITAVGGAVLLSPRAGLMLFASNVISNALIGFANSFFSPRVSPCFYSFCKNGDIGSALTEAVNSAVKSVLAIAAFVILFSALDRILNPPAFLLPILEITNGVCSRSGFTLPEISAFLSFGGICIHLQLLPVILQAGMKYRDFLLWRVISALLSYCTAKLFLLISPLMFRCFQTAPIIPPFSPELIYRCRC